MLLVKAIAVKDRSLYGKIISFFRRSEYSHFAALIDGEVYEMGVKHPQKTQEFYYKWPFDVIAEYDIDNVEVYGRLNDMQNAKYNWLSIIFFYPNRWLKLKIGKSNRNKMCVDYVGHILQDQRLHFKVAPDEAAKILRERK